MGLLPDPSEPLGVLPTEIRVLVERRWEHLISILHIPHLIGRENGCTLIGICGGCQLRKLFVRGGGGCMVARSANMPAPSHEQAL